MKKIYLFLLAAAGVLAAASCAREDLREPVQVLNPDEVTTLTLSLESTRTALVDGKTTWQAGDKVRVYNSTGTFSQDVEIPEEAVGNSAFSVDVNMKDTVYYAVYPVEAADGISSGKAKVVLPSNPDGRFASANICVAEVHNGTTLQLRNVTAVLKINIQSGNVIEILQFNAKNAMNGTFTVDMSGENPELTAVSSGKSATVAVGGIDGDYYIPIAPGDYAKEFSVTALRGNGGYQTKSSSEDNEVKINNLFDLGVIGDDLSTGLSGEGTEANPYVISNLGEYTAFSASVNLGNPYEDKYVSLETDITEPVTSPVGYYLSADEQAAFAGHFLGGDHTIALDLIGDNCRSQAYVALFGMVDEGASVSNLKVSGSVQSEGNYAAGIVGYVRGSSDSRVSLENLTSEAVVKSNGSRVAGVAAYASYADVVNCVNNGAVSGTNSVGGIVGYGYYAVIENSSNNAKIASTATTPTGILLPYYQYYTVDGLNNSASGTWTNGTGGIAGYAQNCDINNSNNLADVEAYMKVGGIVGTAYWTNVNNANNSGNITASGNLVVRTDSQYGACWGSIAGGIAGWVHVYGNVVNCVNSGSVTGLGGVGGIVSLASCGNNSISAINIKDCVNNGAVSATSSYSGGTHLHINVGAGGICAATSAYTYWSSSASEKIVTIENCINKKSVTAANASNSACAVGGIVGNCFNPNRQNGSSVSVSSGSKILKCVNEGDVTGAFYVGGIVGLFGSRYAQVPTVSNCANHGKILSTGYSSKYNGVLIGGLAGGVMAYNTTFRSRSQFNIYNCYNDGDVVYSLDDYATPYVGGVIGSTWGGGVIQNVYSVGNVALASGNTPSEDALKCLGSLVGYHYASILHYCYYPKDIFGGKPVGGGTAARTDTVVGFDESGNLDQSVTANNVECSSLLQALNEWQNYYVNYNYFNWTGAAGHPVFDSTMN